MNAEYYYLDVDGVTVHGPFGMQDMWALKGRGILDLQTSICRAGSDQWKPLVSLPELLPPPEQKPLPLPVSTGRRAGPKNNEGAVFFGIIAAVLAGIGVFYMAVTVSNRSGALAPYSPAPTATPGSPMAAAHPPISAATAIPKSLSSSDASWEDGYKQGYPIGNEAAARHMPMLDQQSLLNAAATAMKIKVHPPNEDEWLKGFVIGFRTGYYKAGT